MWAEPGALGLLLVGGSHESRGSGHESSVVAMGVAAMGCVVSAVEGVESHDVHLISAMDVR